MTEIRLDFDFGHPPALVWRALTERRQLTRWFMPGDLEPIQGSQFQLLPDALPGFDGPIAGQVLEVSAERRLVMRWKGEQLHARVAWELRPKPEGCLLMVSQSGFLGVRGSARRQALVATYDRLFGERLPAVLDGLAGKADALVPRPPRLAAPVAPKPDRRRQILAIVAAALVIGLASALIANLPSETSEPAEARASGTSGQSTVYTSASAASTATAIDATQRPPSASPSPTPSVTSTRPTTVAPSTPPRVERSTTAAPAPAVLAARYSPVSSGALVYRGAVVVENSGGTTSGDWTLTITVPLLAVVNGVEGPQPRLTGAGWTFSGSPVPGGGSTRVVFDVVLNVLGPGQPLTCEVGGEDCAGL
ncbi:SRPBCC domain-containing protein [Phytohabitans sp. ZYX-F-186]|uniref:SRPBCC domain-containing protein n=1 Tax=Phytohabitans maris TaxID=3071409 RepID=A0ABU0ZEI5_9ACTN|nr:SRPBCC domain-containing protein [Phytohabitans sp. ZYX-F-186]MDQ7904839.1 SRPBCC domain-containing protein [Phytohabitans sp. ZYX-F-186]